MQSLSSLGLFRTLGLTWDLSAAQETFRYSGGKLLKSEEDKVMPRSLLGPGRMWTLYGNLQSDQEAQSF